VLAVGQSCVGDVGFCIIDQILYLPSDGITTIAHFCVAIIRERYYSRAALISLEARRHLMMAG